jgi:hypothetical protein
MGIKLQGGNNSTNLASVNSLNQLQVVTPKTLVGACAGFVQLSSEGDPGAVLKTRTVIAPEASDDYRLRTGIDQSVFNSTFEGSTILTTQWSQNFSAFGSLQANGFFLVNSTAVTTASGAGYLRTWRHFPMFGTYPLYVDMWIRETNQTASNAISEWGFLYLTTSTTQQPIDGIYFRRISGGQLKGIITNNSLDLEEITLDLRNVPSRVGSGAYDPAETNHYLISFHSDIVRFWINDVLVGQLQCPSQLSQFAASSQLPIGFRVLNVNTASAGRQLSIGYVNVGYGDHNVNKSWAHAMSGMGGGAYQLQIGNTPGPTVTRTAATTGHPASATTRTAGTWIATSNPQLNNLGGLWTSPAFSTLTTDGDYPLFSFLNPAGTASLPGKTLYVTGVRIGDTYVSTAPGSTGAFLSYIVQVEGSAVSTATADAATTTSGKSIAIGGQGFGTTDVAGTIKPGFEMSFNSPLIVPPNKYFTLIARPYGTLSGAPLIVTSSVAVNGYWE